MVSRCKRRNLSESPDDRQRDFKLWISKTREDEGHVDRSCGSLSEHLLASKRELATANVDVLTRKHTFACFRTQQSNWVRHLFVTANKTLSCEQIDLPQLD